MSVPDNENLPRLRFGIDIIPSPIAESPGLILRDPFRYSQAILLIPSGWVPALGLLDGKNTARDIQTTLTRVHGGQLVRSEDVRRHGTRNSVRRRIASRRTPAPPTPTMPRT
jgi:hypothetical protein